MDTPHDIALTHALAAIPGPVPPSGVLHAVIPHTSRFTVVGNHLAQHTELSLVAIGIGVHIQSLPAGSKVGIKALAARFPEGEVKIACALRELEARGYLHRTRVRLPKGRVATRTVFCNQPGAVLRGGVVPLVGPAVRVPALAPAVARGHIRVPEPVAVAEPTAVPEHRPVPEPVPVPEHRPVPEPVPVPESVPVPQALHAQVRLPSRTAPTQPRRPLPHPRRSPRSCGRPPPRSSPICGVTRRSWCPRRRPSRSWCPGWPPGSNGTRPPTRSGAPSRPISRSR